MADQAPKTIAKPARRGEGGASGAVKAALWVLSADEELAVNTLANLEEGDIRRLNEVVRHLGETTSEQLDAVHKEFQSQLKPGVLHLRGSKDYLSRLATRALGEERATRLLTTRPTPSEQPSANLARADLEVLVPVLSEEHPQIIAAVLASLDSSRSAEILKRLPEGIRAETVRRMARIVKVPQSALGEVERVLSAGLPTGDGDSEVDGVRQAALILNQLEGNLADSVLSQLKSDELVGHLRRAMFTFDDLGRLDKRAFQVLLKEVPSDQLLTALKTASNTIREAVFASLSKRASEMLRDDLEVMGPVRLADVEQAQQAIVDTALRLRSEGKLAIAGGGGEELV